MRPSSDVRHPLRGLVFALVMTVAPSPASAGADACPERMAAVEDFCVDLFEVPNLSDAAPLVMYTFNEAEAWCQQRGKRLCYDDEWTRACAGSSGFAYPYGDTHLPGVCNDEEMWLAYEQTLLNGWPAEVSNPNQTSLAGLLAAARAVSQAGAAAADHVEYLYQGEGSGTNAGCESPDAVFDLVGNAEEWTRRRDGGTPGFSGSLKGRYWAESRTCQQAITSHSNTFRFYQLGFRCCLVPTDVFRDDFESGSFDAWDVVVSD